MIFHDFLLELFDILNAHQRQVVVGFGTGTVLLYGRLQSVDHLARG